MANIAKEKGNEGPKSTKLNTEKNYHSIDEFFDLSFEDLFKEPVHILDDAEEAEVLAFGDEGLVISEERFLELEFEALFDQPVRLSRKLNDNEESEAAYSVVQSEASSLSIVRTPIGNEGTEESEVRVLSIPQENLSTEVEITPTGNSEQLPPLAPNVVLTGVTSADGFGGALQEDTALGVQTVSGNLFTPSDNLFGVVPGGTGGVSIKIFTRPGAGQTIDDDSGDIVTVTTPYGNTFEYNKVTNDYTYTLNGPVMHKNLAPTNDGNDDNDMINLPITDGDDPALYDLPYDFTPFNFISRPNIDPDNDGVPTVKEIVDAVFSDVGGVVVFDNIFGLPYVVINFNGYTGGLSNSDLPFNPDAHNGLPGGPAFFIPKIDAAFIDEFNQSGDDFDIGRAFYDVVVIDVTNGVGQTSRGFAIFKILDDIPILIADINQVDETAFFVNGEMEQTTGNLLINDDKGLDNGVILSMDGAIDDDSDGFITVTRIGDNNVESMITVDVTTGEYTYDLLDATNGAVTRIFDIEGDGALDLISDDVYTYVFEDNDGDQATSTLTVAVNLNEGPTANPDSSYAIDENTDLTVNAALGLLTNDTDPDVGDTKSVVSVNSDPNNVGKAFTFNILDLFVNELPSGFEVNPIVTVNQDGSLSLDVNNANAPHTISFQSDIGNVDYLEAEFDTTNQFDFMSKNDTASILIGYSMGDAEFGSINGDGTTSSDSTFTITISGVNDAPIAKDLSISTDENTGFIGVQLDANDIDTDNNPLDLVYTIKSVDDPSFASNVATVSNKLDFTQGTDFDYLSQGQELIIKVTYNATDIHGDVSNDAVANIVVTGLNDDPLFITDNQSDSVAEVMDGLATEGKLVTNLNGVFKYQDVDLQDTHNHVVTPSTTAADSIILGAFSSALIQTDNITGDGTLIWNYAIQDSQLESLGEDETITETFTLTIDDNIASTVRTVTIALTGTNDAPIIVMADSTGDVTELVDGDDDENSIIFTADGTIDFEDLDLSDGHNISPMAKPAGYLGDFTASISNVSTGDGKGVVDWNFIVNDAALDSLGKGEQRVQVYTVEIVDDESATALQNVTITITGTNDDPTITAFQDTGTVTEITSGEIGEDEEDLTAMGVINFADVDLTDAHTLTITPSANDYLGKLEATVTDASTNDGAGEVTWTFTVNDADLDSLGASDMPTQMYAIEIDDGEGGTVIQNVTITLNGANDAPTITSDTGSVTEDTAAPGNADSGNLMPVDVDGPSPYSLEVSFMGGGTKTINSNDAGVIQIMGAYGLLDVAGDGTWVYVLDDTLDDVLNKGEVVQEEFDVVISDSLKMSAGTINVEVTGVNDLPTSADKSTDVEDDEFGYTFMASDFAFMDVDGDDIQFTSIQITTLETNVDSLKYNGNDVTLNQVILIEDISDGLLTYDFNGDMPPVSNNYDNFQYSINDGTADSLISFTQMINVVAAAAPVVLDLNLDNNIHLISADNSDVTFERNGQLVQMGWVGPEDGFLVYDVDGNGGFSGLHEIILADYHPDATTDLEGLKLAFDSNADNIFDAQDAAWLDFGVWQDKNSDGISDDGEFSTLANAGVISIALDSDNQLHTDEGNTVYGYSEYTLASGETGLVGDVGLEITLEESDVLQDSEHALSDLIASTESSEFIISESEEVAPEPTATSFEENQVIEQMVQSSQDQTGI